MKKRPRITRILPNSGKLKIGSSNPKLGTLLHLVHTPKTL